MRARWKKYMILYSDDAVLSEMNILSEYIDLD